MPTFKFVAAVILLYFRFADDTVMFADADKVDRMIKVYSFHGKDSNNEPYQHSSLWEQISCYVLVSPTI